MKYTADKLIIKKSGKIDFIEGYVYFNLESDKIEFPEIISTGDTFQIRFPYNESRGSEVVIVNGEKRNLLKHHLYADTKVDAYEGAYAFFKNKTYLFTSGKWVENKVPSKTKSKRKTK
jgi:hypothetical protein